MPGCETSAHSTTCFPVLPANPSHGGDAPGDRGATGKAAHGGIKGLGQGDWQVQRAGSDWRHPEVVDAAPFTLLRFLGCRRQHLVHGVEVAFQSYLPQLEILGS